jgi:hypothetical protein
MYDSTPGSANLFADTVSFDIESPAECTGPMPGHHPTIVHDDLEDVNQSLQITLEQSTPALQVYRVFVTFNVPHVLQALTTTAIRLTPKLLSTIAPRQHWKRFIIQSVSNQAYKWADSSYGIVCPATPVLIDADYEGAHVVRLGNYAKGPIHLYGVLLRFEVFWNVTTFPAPNYDLTMFTQLAPHESQGVERIVKFTVGSPGANGIDLTLKDIFFGSKFIIEPKGILHVTLPFNDNRALHSFPNLIMLRSSVSRKGITLKISLDERARPLCTLMNNSPVKVKLGDRFLQLVLPRPYCFDITMDLLYRLCTPERLPYPLAVIRQSLRTEKEVSANVPIDTL